MKVHTIYEVKRILKMKIHELKVLEIKRGNHIDEMCGKSVNENNNTTSLFSFFHLCTFILLRPCTFLFYYCPLSCNMLNK